jgi:hypothetical protein
VKSRKLPLLSFFNFTQSFFNYKLPVMKKLFLFAACNYILTLVTAQPEPTSNVGIGTSTPARAKLEVFGVAGTGGHTSGLFGGDGAGISLQRNRPTIGFNQYNDGISKFMTTGYGAIQYFDPATGTLSIDMLGTGTANTPATALTPALAIANTGNIGIKTIPASNASLFVTRGSNFGGTAIFGGTAYGSYFNYSFNEDTYIRGGKPGGSVILNDIPNGLTLLGANSTNTTEVYGKLYGYGSSPLASSAMNLVPLGVVKYQINVNNIIGGTIPSSYENLVGNFVTGSSGFYSDGIGVADHVDIFLQFDMNIYNQYSMVIGMNNLNFNGDPGFGSGKALLTQLVSKVHTANGSSSYLISVGVDDFGNIGPSEIAEMSGTVIFYGLR